MKKLIIMSILGTLSLAAMGQDTSAPNTVTIRGSTIQAPDKIYRMDRDEINKFLGWYELSDGKSLSLSSERNGLYAKVEGQPRHEVVAVAPDTFVATDRKMKIVLDQDEETNQGIVKAGKLYMVVTTSPTHPINDVSMNGN